MSMCSETASKDYSSAFRTYDIRSIYDQPIDTTFAYSLGKALGKHLSDTKGSQASMVIAADTRKANNDLVSYFLQGVMESGISYLWNLGQPVGQERTRGVGSTAMVYRMTQQVFDMGVMFTASHNPAEYVGMKVVDHEGDLIPTEQLRERISTYESPTDPVDPATVLAKLNRHDRLAKQVDQVMYDLKDRYERLYSELRHKRKVLVDYSGGSGVGYEQAFLRWIETQGWVEFIAINDLPDSEFSAHLSDTSDVVNYEQLQAAVRLHEADMGIMFDGDADRLGFVDEQGAYVLGDVAGAVIARRLLESAGENSPKTIIAEVSCTHALEEIAAKHGGDVIRTRVGHRFIKEAMQAHGAVFAEEYSAHFMFAEMGGVEHPLLALGYLLQELDKYESFSSMIAEVHDYYKPPLENFVVGDKQAVLNRLKATFEDCQVDETDGVKIVGKDFWFLVRPSNTEPKLRFTVEAENQERADEVISKVKRQIEQ